MTPHAREILNSTETLRLAPNIFDYHGTWYWIDDDVLATELRHAFEKFSESTLILSGPLIWSTGPLGGG